ncbi:CocE/NonD family hydrolase [Streptomyces ipomoeae]|uniref:CocE/NonD family hydrolase n=1 Tax=Streptomyces ipomoeae TaxID=103232 RepID=UPI001C66D5B6|nr:CocE/NonD family hydrolase [Streptomyces ipomoeae]MDX2825104.1 CocE/NonD family hydrolase [Streptomyces ipomoeae]MDX2877826.1 CocE/NonD family hydrolase [Streptomyces ipomoeae]
MNLISHLIQRRLKLSPPTTRDLAVERDLRIPMPDGVELLADRWAPRTGGEGLPTALIRTPYGRRGPFGTMLARPLAERGYQVLIQSVRGGFGSGGTFDPMRQERADGLATLDWLVKQPWSGDAIVLYGMSYLGHVQWAVADRLPPQVKAMVPQVTESALTLEFLRADGMSLETPFGWGALVGTQERRLAVLRQPARLKKTAQALWTLPLGRADVAAIGERSAYIQDILAHDADAPRWTGLDHRDRVAEVTVPVSSIAGWYDIFLPGQLRDFRVLQDAGRPARLTVEPWTHAEFTGVPFEEALEFGLAHARGEQPPPRPPVRLYVMGEEAWRDFASWLPNAVVKRS